MPRVFPRSCSRWSMFRGEWREGGAHPGPGQEIYLRRITLHGKGAAGQFDYAATVAQMFGAVGWVFQGGQAQWLRMAQVAAQQQAQGYKQNNRHGGSAGACAGR